MASEITSLTIVYSTVYSGADQRKHQSSVPLAFVRGIHRWPVNSPDKWPVTQKMFPFDDVIMTILILLPHLSGTSELKSNICCNVWLISIKNSTLVTDAEFFLRNIPIYFHFLLFLNIEMAQIVEILSYGRKDLFILHSQYHGCWCPGDARSQGISSQGIGVVIPEYSDISTQNHYRDVLMSAMVYQITRLCTQPFAEAQIKENIKALRHWPLWGEPPVTSGFPPQGRLAQKMLTFHNIIMILVSASSMFKAWINCMKNIMPNCIQVGGKWVGLSTERFLENNASELAFRFSFYWYY